MNCSLEPLSLQFTDILASMFCESSFEELVLFERQVNENFSSKRRNEIKLKFPKLEFRLERLVAMWGIATSCCCLLAVQGEAAGSSLMEPSGGATAIGIRL